MEQNFIQYKTGELYRTIRPPVVSTIDMETINKPVSNDPRTSHLHPQGATKEQQFINRYIVDKLIHIRGICQGPKSCFTINKGTCVMCMWYQSIIESLTVC